MKILVALISILLLSACAVGPTYERPELNLPESFGHEASDSFSADEVNMTSWWMAFNDPILDDLIHLGFENNLDLRIGALRLLEARMNLGSSQSTLFPEVSLSGSTTMSEPSEHAAAATPKTKTYQLGASIQWEVDFWGRLRNGIALSDATLNATEADFHALRALIAAEVTNAYITYRSAERRLELTSENVKIQAKVLSDTRAQFEEGDNTLLDVSQAEALYADTQSLIPGLIREQINARNALATLLAMRFSEVDSKLAQSTGLPTLDEAINVSVPNSVIRQRPDIQTAEWNAIGAAADLGVKNAERYPNISLSSSLLFQVIDGIPTKAGGAGGSSLSDLANAESFFYSILPSIQLPIFDAGNRKSRVRAADARYQSALENLKRSVLIALEEVDNAMTQVETSRLEAKHLQMSVEAYTKAHNIASIQFQEGDIGFVSVLDSMRQRVNQELRLVQSQSNASTGTVSLFKALGGGWQAIEAPLLGNKIVDEMIQRSDWAEHLGEKQ